MGDRPRVEVDLRIGSADRGHAESARHERREGEYRGSRPGAGGSAILIHHHFAGAYRVLSAVNEVATRGVLFVGEDNPQSADPKFALWNEPIGCAGSRLQENILSLPEDWYRAMWRTNLCNPRWSRDEAEQRTFELTAGDAPWSLLVLLGRRVAGAFGVQIGRTLRPFESTEHSRSGQRRVFRLLSLPHPSGRCRDWNYRSTYDETFRKLRDLAPEIPWGGIH